MNLDAYDKNRVRKVIIIFTVFVMLSVGSVLYVLYHQAADKGKIDTTIHLLPQDATLVIDGRTGNTNELLSAGSHTFTAKKDGFSDQTITMDISNTVNNVYIALNPESPQARRWYLDGKYSPQYETFSALPAQYFGKSISEKHPLIDELPYTDTAYRFRIDYGFSDPKDKYKIFILISEGTPATRWAAIEWLHSKGFDPATLDIRYTNYTNPLGEQQ